MRGNKTWYAAAGLVAVLALVAVGGGFAVANGAIDSDQPITGPALGEASAAALAHTGGGTVTDTEVGDEDGYYEVEVTLADGSQVDVHLDVDFNILGTKPDNDSGVDDGEDGAAD